MLNLLAAITGATIIRSSSTFVMITGAESRLLTLL
jgi:hypothetical protein